MTTRINLLPWREQLRNERQQQLMVTTIAAVVLMLAIIALVHFQYADQLQTQNARNQFLEREIAQLDLKINEIQELEKEKQNLLARMNIIQQLQGRRPEVVHVFDELVTTLPDGVYLTSIKDTGTAITLEGVAQSNARVSSYMRNIEISDWLAKPQLNIIERQAGRDATALRINRFILRVGHKSKRTIDVGGSTP